MGHRFTDASGSTVLESLLAVALFGLLAGAAIPTGLMYAEYAQARGAARYLASRLQQARMEAVKRSTHVGLYFETTRAGIRFGLYADGNGNGLRTRDIRAGIDRLLGLVEGMPERFPEVAFGIRENMPGIEAAGSLAEGGDPIRIGDTNILSFSPIGSATGGTLYLRTRRYQTAVRVLGVTGRVRTFRFDLATRQWKTP